MLESAKARHFGETKTFYCFDQDRSSVKEQGRRTRYGNATLCFAIWTGLADAIGKTYTIWQPGKTGIYTTNRE